jgi:ABC-type sugar transport system substrate-binding protein
MHRSLGKFALVASSIMVASLGLTACGEDSSSGGGSSDSFKIGYMIFDTSVPFYSNLISSAKAEAQKEGVDLDIQNGNNDLSTEISVVQQFISKSVDLILISPSDPKGIVPAITQAKAANIPVMAVNTNAESSDAAPVITYVGVDDVQFGKLQGELLHDAVGETGQVGYITGQLGTSAQINREKGLLETLAAYPGIKIVNKTAANWDNAKALAATQDMLNKYPKGQLDAIVGQGPETATGAKFASQNGRSDVKFVVGDFPQDVLTAITDGYVYGTVNQDPAPQGQKAIEYAVYYLKGEKDKVPTPQAFLDLPKITKDNVGQFKAAWGG